MRPVAERIRQSVADMPFDIDQGPLNVTISVGVALFTEECPNLATLLNDADIALYAAKKVGKDQVKVKGES